MCTEVQRKMCSVAILVEGEQASWSWHVVPNAVLKPTVVNLKTAILISHIALHPISQRSQPQHYRRKHGEYGPRHDLGPRSAGSQG
jgi:hypothetical protein